MSDSSDSDVPRYTKRKRKRENPNRKKKQSRARSPPDEDGPSPKFRASGESRSSDADNSGKSDDDEHGGSKRKRQKGPASSKGKSDSDSDNSSSSDKEDEKRNAKKKKKNKTRQKPRKSPSPPPRPSSPPPSQRQQSPPPSPPPRPPPRQPPRQEKEKDDDGGRKDGMGSARQQPPRQADAAADAKSGMSPSDSLPVCSGGAGPVIPLIESEYEGLTGHPSDPCFICCDLHDIPIYELRVAEMRKRFQVGYGHVQSKVWVTEILAFCANTFTFPKNKPLTWSLRSVYEHFVQPHKVMDPATERVKQIKHVNLEIAKIERKFLFKIDDNGKEVLCVKTAKLLDSKRAYLLKLMIASK